MRGPRRSATHFWRATREETSGRRGGVVTCAGTHVSQIGATDGGGGGGRRVTRRLRMRGVNGALREEETECSFDSGVRRSRGHCSGIASGASSPTIQPTQIIFDIVQIRSPHGLINHCGPRGLLSSSIRGRKCRVLFGPRKPFLRPQGYGRVLNTSRSGRVQSCSSGL